MKTETYSKKYGRRPIFQGAVALLLLSSWLASAIASADDLVIKLKDGTRLVYSLDEIESITFLPDGSARTDSGIFNQSTPQTTLHGILNAINSNHPELVLDLLGRSDGSGPFTEAEKAQGGERVLRDLLELKGLDFRFGEEIVARESEGEWHVIPAEPKGMSWRLYFAFLRHDGKWFLCDIDED